MEPISPQKNDSSSPNYFSAYEQGKKDGYNQGKAIIAQQRDNDLWWLSVISAMLFVLGGSYMNYVALAAEQSVHKHRAHLVATVATRNVVIRREKNRRRALESSLDDLRAFMHQNYDDIHSLFTEKRMGRYRRIEMKKTMTKLKRRFNHEKKEIKQALWMCERQQHVTRRFLELRWALRSVGCLLFFAGGAAAGKFA
eukprot:PhF_6_TR9740/c0_g1_i1/m.15006